MNQPSNRRRCIRETLGIPVVVEIIESKIRLLDGTLDDISTQGAMFMVPEEPAKDTKVRVHVKNKENHAVLSGRILWNKTVGEGYRAGMAFDENSADSNNLAMDIIAREIINESKTKL